MVYIFGKIFQGFYVFSFISGIKNSRQKKLKNKNLKQKRKQIKKLTRYLRALRSKFSLATPNQNRTALPLPAEHLCHL